MRHPAVTRRAAAAVALLAAAAACAAAPRDRGSSAPAPTPSRARDSAAIHDAIVRGAAAFAAGDADGVLAHYASDVVLSYPGIPDADYATLARGYRDGMRARPAGTAVTTAPTFDEILVADSLAVVRVRWTTTVRTASPPRTDTRHLRDLQVWRRGGDGRWTFVRGMHYRDSTAAPTP